MKIHILDKTLIPTHLAFGVYKNYKTKCGQNANKVSTRVKVFSGENVCLKCMKVK